MEDIRVSGSVYQDPSVMSLTLLYNDPRVVIPAKAEILLRVIILQLVRFHSINRDEVLRNKGNPS